jgi:hypothetical protein
MGPMAYSENVQRHQCDYKLMQLLTCVESLGSGGCGMGPKKTPVPVCKQKTHRQ